MGPVAVEPLLCPSTFQDLAESGPLEPEAAFASKEVSRQLVRVKARILPNRIHLMLKLHMCRPCTNVQ